MGLIVFAYYFCWKFLFLINKFNLIIFHSKLVINYLMLNINFNEIKIYSAKILDNFNENVLSYYLSLIGIFF